MNGILILNKEKGLTSREVVDIVSKKLGIKKIGHTGTLDPLAHGVLVLCIGEGTKLVELITDTYKEYEAEITLGILTETLDLEGKVIKKENVSFTKEEIISAINSMKGKYLQEVPIYSAVRVNGKKLYEYAREGIEVTLPKREVDILDIELSSDIEYSDVVKFKIKTTVSKGTYIRSLVRDIASKLGTVGIMSDLIRTKQGRFDIKDSCLIDEVSKDKIISIDEALNNLYTVDMDDILYKKIVNGVKMPNTYNKDYVLYKYNGDVVAIYKNDNNILRMYKIFTK